MKSIGGKQMADKKVNRFTAKEKTLGLFYMIMLFLAVSGTCSYFMFFSNPNLGSSDGKALAMEGLKRISAFQKFQGERMEKLELLDGKVNAIDPGLKASYEKSEVKYMLGEFNKDYEDNRFDDRFRIFALVSRFYEYKMFTKERIWASKKNIQHFSDKYDFCEGCIESLNKE